MEGAEASTIEAGSAVREPELIADHSLVAGESDLFDHRDYVERLVQIVDTVDVGQTSANIALYGAWGSGKSGIANALEERLHGREDLLYAEFEAFKFGRDPLLRNFVGRLSEQLFANDESRRRVYRRRLYESTSRPFVDLDRMLEEHPVRVGLVAVPVCFLTAAAVLIWVWPGNHHDLREAGNWLKLVGFLVFGVFLTYFTLSRSRTPAASDEEFEAIFRDMLRRKEIDGESKKRLVVFVDELDRCAPSEVAATLEAIRTFLGVKGCIFIVAADQQVLEHALTEKLRQSTPPDPANPYYSAGSAYLDKIFQYQLSFPPLRPRRLSGYALELVADRGGVWADPAIDKEDVVSILLPTHIHSPRRVKVLLNAFALSYGIASARAERNNLADVPGRAAELAKLVCIELEFPLFAGELFLDERLTDAVLWAARALEGDEAAAGKLAGLPVRLRGLGTLYAEGRLPVAQLLSGGGEEGRGGKEWSRARDEDEWPEEAEREEGRSEEDEGEGDEAETSAEERVREEHAIQLVRYLEKTETVEGPRSDLIHMESAGAVWGLDAQTAQNLERDARDNRARDVALRVAGLLPEERPKALLMLGSLVRELVGRDADNAMSALLAGAGAAEVPLEAVAHELVRDLEAYDDRRGLRKTDLAGAFAIAMAADRETLVDRILARPEAESDPELALRTLEAAPRLLDGHLDTIIEVMPVAVAVDPERTKAALDQLGPEQAAEVLRAATEPILDWMTATAAAMEPEPEETEVARQVRVAREMAMVPTRLAELYLPGTETLAELALLPIFGLHFSGEAIFEWLPRISPARTTEVTVEILKLLDQWGAEETVPVLRALDPALAGGIESAPAALDQMTAHLWNELSGGSEMPEALADELSRITAGGLRPSGTLALERVRPDLDRTVASDAELETFESAERRAVSMSEAGLLPRAFVADCSVRTAGRSFALPMPEPRPGRVDAGLQESLEWLAEDASQDALAASLEEIQGGSWLGPGATLAAELTLRAALRSHQEVVVPSAAEVAAHLSEDAEYASAAKIWIEQFAASPDEVTEVVRPTIGDLPDELQEGIAAYAGRLGAKQLAVLNLPAIEGAFETRPAPLFFEAAQLERADPEPIADALVGLAEQAENRTERTLVLDIWSQMKPTRRVVRERLIREVLLRFAEKNAAGHDLVRGRLELARNPPRGLKEELLKRLIASANSKERARKLERKMAEVGLLAGSRSLLGRLFGRG